MNINEYYNDLRKKSDEIYEKTMKDTDQLGKAHHYAATLYEVSNLLKYDDEKDMLKTVCIQLEYSTLNLVKGLYRSAFSSLRLAFEMGLGLVYFSADKLKHFEWKEGKEDIKWSKLIDPEDGVLSKKFFHAFSPSLSKRTDEFNSKAKKVYRSLSEFVHGNNDTWGDIGISLNFDEKLVTKYFKTFDSVYEILMFSIISRYLTLLNKEDIEQIINEDLSHVDELRKYIGAI